MLTTLQSRELFSGLLASLSLSLIYLCSSQVSHALWDMRPGWGWGLAWLALARTGGNGQKEGPSFHGGSCLGCQLWGSRFHVQGQPPLYSELEANLTNPRTRVQSSEPVYKMLSVVVGTGDPSTGDTETENLWCSMASKSHLISVPQTHEWSLSQRRQVDG